MKVTVTAVHSRLAWRRMGFTCGSGVNVLSRVHAACEGTRCFGPRFGGWKNL